MNFVDKRSLIFLKKELFFILFFFLYQNNIFAKLHFVKQPRLFCSLC